MRNRFYSLLQEEDGAVSVDWVVLTAAVCGLGFAVALALGPTLLTKNGSLNRQISDHEVKASFPEPE